MSSVICSVSLSQAVSHPRRWTKESTLGMHLAYAHTRHTHLFTCNRVMGLNRMQHPLCSKKTITATRRIGRWWWWRATGKWTTRVRQWGVAAGHTHTQGLAGKSPLFFHFALIRHIQSCINASYSHIHYTQWQWHWHVVILLLPNGNVVSSHTPHDRHLHNVELAHNATLPLCHVCASICMHRISYIVQHTHRQTQKWIRIWAFNANWYWIKSSKLLSQIETKWEWNVVGCALGAAFQQWRWMATTIGRQIMYTYCALSNASGFCTQTEQMMWNAIIRKKLRLNEWRKSV